MAQSCGTSAQGSGCLELSFGFELGMRDSFVVYEHFWRRLLSMWYFC
jgi:hypothetical protein